jgi:hypothetical protein
MLASMSRQYRDTRTRTKFRTYLGQVLPSKYTGSSKRRPCFYDLPAEVRVIIYDYIFDGHCEQKSTDHEFRINGFKRWNNMLSLLGRAPSMLSEEALFADLITTRQVPLLRITATVYRSALSISCVLSVSRAYRTRVISNARRMPPVTAASKLVRQEILPLFFKRFYAMSPNQNIPWFARLQIQDTNDVDAIGAHMNHFLCEHTTRFVYHQGPIIITLANGIILPDAKSSAALCAENPYSDTNVHHDSPLWSMNLAIVNAEFAFTPPYGNDIALHFNEHRSPILYDENDPRRAGVGFVTEFGEGLYRAILRFTNARQKLGGSALAVVQLWEQCRHWEVQMMRNAVLKKGKWVLDADLRLTYWGPR